MADLKITQLPTKAVPVSADILPIVNSVGITNEKITIGTLPISTATQTALNLKENSSNKTTDFTGNTGSNLLFPTVKAIYDALVGYLSGYQPLLGYTPANENLSNLPSTSIGASLNPDTDLFYDIGQSGANWRRVNAGELMYDDSPTIDLLTRKLIDSNIKDSIDFESRQLLDPSEILAADYSTRELKDAGNLKSIDWNLRQTFDDSEEKSIDYLDRRLFSKDGVSVSIDWDSNDGPTTITQVINNNSTKIATTAYVDRIPVFNPSKYITIFDDFMGASAVSALGWSVSNFGVGSVNTSTVGGATSTGAFGVYSFSTGSTATGRSCNFAGVNTLIFGQGVVRYVWRVQLLALSDVTNTYTFYAGLGDNSAAGDMVDGVYFLYTDSLNGGNWTASTANNSVRTTLNSGVAVAANVWVNLEARVNAAGNLAEFFINGVSVGTIATNIPTAINRESGPITKMQKTVGLTSRTMFNDYFYMDYTPTTPR